MSVPYHKITPIYQCIDSGNWKGAVKLCQKKDLSKWDLTKALLAYSLVQLERKEQALEVALEVKGNESTDEGTLSALTLTFKALGRHADAVECYEAAARKCPSNEAFAIETLNAYAGMGDFKKMQQGSQRMYKTSGNSKYVFWSVSCMLLQEYPFAMLDLAEKMLTKVFDGDKKGEQPGGEELSLLVAILRNRAAHSSVAVADKCDVLESCLDRIQDLSSRPISVPIKDETMVKARDGGDGSLVKAHPQHLQLLRIQILKDLHEIHHAMAGDIPTDKRLNTTRSMTNLLNEVLTDLPDQWDALQTLVKIQCDAHCNNACSNDEKVKKANEFHDELLKMQKTHPSARGTYLAEMLYLEDMHHIIETNAETYNGIWWMSKNDCEDELTSHLSNINIASGDNTLLVLSSYQKELIRLLIQYISIFESKQCLFTDVKSYLKALKKSASSSSDKIAVKVLQSWVQERAGMLISELSELTAAPGRDEDPTVKTATLLLCRISKLLQIDCYYGVNDCVPTAIPSMLTSIPACKRLYADTYALLAGKGIGGLREVQPGDELLMLCSSQMLQQVCKTTDTPQDYLSGCLDWAETVILGREASPHNYCFSVESFEPLRRLACVEYAMDGFNMLQVKYIQLDSMSYLILPALLEGGFFTEFRKLSKNIIKFHESAKRDTLSMIGKCLKNANYAKSLELGKFTKKCQNSMQLALTKAELPLIEVAEDLHSVSDVLTYLQNYVTEAIPESQPELSDAEIAHLDENMDYNLLTRINDTSHTGNQKEPAEAALKEESNDIRSYQQQYKHRIVTCQSFVRLMLVLLQDGQDGVIKERLNSCWSQQFGSLDAHGGLCGSGDSCATISCPNDTNSNVKWSQAIDYGSSSTETYIWILVYRMSYLCNICVDIFKSPGADNDQSNQDSRLSIAQGLSQNILKLLENLQDEVLGSTEKCNRYVVSGDSDVLLQPLWIKQMSGIVRMLLCWGVVILASTRQQLGGGSSTGKSAAKKKKNKKAKETNNNLDGGIMGDVKESFVAVTRSFKNFTDNIVTALTTEMQDSSRTVVKTVAFLDSVLPPPVSSESRKEADSTEKVVDGNGDISFRATRKELAKHLLSSQILSCTRLSDSIQKKLPLIQGFNNLF